MKWTTACRALLLAAGLGCGLGAAQAQGDWPTKPVTVVVPSSPGGGTDTYGRLLAQALTEQLKQSFVVDNKPGASGAIGATYAAKAPPDGYTLLVASNSSLGINPALYKTLSYDVFRDFAPVTRGVIAPMVIVANPGANVKTLRELVERGKREPGTLFYGSAGVGSPLYIGVRMIEAATGAQFNHIPYKGVAPAYQDLLGGRVQFMLTDLASVRQYIDAGKLTALAITDKSKLLPNVPTLAEAGVPGIKAFTAFSVMVPAKTPPALVKRIAGEIQKAMQVPANAQKLEQQALVPVVDTPEQFAASLKEEQQSWAGFIRQQNIQPE
ncbi:Bug family tripartite tricarboxylate transporter substrate binding protein [Azohydromonas caseinilytica]|uniref:Tripartite tricarboxylate transporter substrate binding protein n=1 Tax=Azohydromonas caseinilytica TaxID=2728836 RepID=A0A848F9V4_9BURK|nr:tripartite tricarboxylate transporter substrate binding protein [Azohydromonas caseinilytica]NML16038.1 tripartite tricarboxylate transporter substrate binding protein [Azohydromonas caseinilytica]